MKKIIPAILLSFQIGIGVFGQTWTNVQKFSGDTVEAALGIAMDVSNNYAIIGTYRLNKARLLHFNGNEWVVIATLTPSDAVYPNNFGHSVSIDENTVVIGASADDDLGYRSGSVYVFEKPSTGWVDMTETAKLHASDGTTDDYFGYSVDISGDCIVAGAYEDADNGTESGSAYIFEKPVTGWVDTTETIKLKASDGQPYDKFGNWVSISKETAAIGGFLTNNVYIFERSLSGWIDTTETAVLTASDGNSMESFGRSIDISDDIIVVGAINGLNDGINSGSAYIYERPDSGWHDTTETSKIFASDGLSDDMFGSSVSILGDIIVIGAAGDDDHGEGSGSAYVFEKTTNNWISGTETKKIVPSDGAEADYFGHTAGISGETIFIGACWADDNGERTGSIYIYEKGQVGNIINEQTKSISVYPNPANERIYIQSEGIYEASVVLADLAGRIIFEEHISQNTNSFDLSGLSNGIYILIIRNGDGSLIKKIIKE